MFRNRWLEPAFSGHQFTEMHADARLESRRTDRRDAHYTREDVLRLLECEPDDGLGEQDDQHRTAVDDFLADRLTACEQLLLEAGLDPAEERREAVA